MLQNIVFLLQQFTTQQNHNCLPPIKGYLKRTIKFKRFIKQTPARHMTDDGHSRGCYHAEVAKGGCPPFVGNLCKLLLVFRLPIPTRSTPCYYKKHSQIGKILSGYVWCTRRESNPQPSPSEGDALSSCATSACFCALC